MEKSEKEEKQRLDKWLDVARFFKTRSQAAKACDDRKVKVNDVTSKSSKYIKPGDEIVIRKKSQYRSFRVVAISHRNIPPHAARELYEETTESKLSPEERELVQLTIKNTPKTKPQYPGRPTKKERREISKFRGY